MFVFSDCYHLESMQQQTGDRTGLSAPESALYVLLTLSIIFHDSFVRSKIYIFNPRAGHATLFEHRDNDNDVLGGFTDKQNKNVSPRSSNV